MEGAQPAQSHSAAQTEPESPWCLFMGSRIFPRVGGCWGQEMWEAFQKLSWSGLRFYNIPCVPVLCYTQRFPWLKNMWALWVTTLWNSHVFQHGRSIGSIRVIIAPCLLIYFKSNFFSQCCRNVLVLREKKDVMEDFLLVIWTRRNSVCSHPTLSKCVFSISLCQLLSGFILNEKRNYWINAQAVSVLC